MRYALGEKLMKQIMLIIGTIIFSSAAALASADDVKSAQTKIDKWKDGFINHCQNQFEKTSGARKSKDYCRCIVDNHREFILTKIKEGEKIDVDQHLKDLLAIYQNGSSKTDDNDNETEEITIVDIDIEFSKKCLEKNKGLKARSTPAKK